MASNLFLHEELHRGTGYIEKLSKKLITICGAGALGSNFAEALVRMGATKIRVIDFDRVEQHNVSTQTYGLKDVGAYKVAALQARLFDVARVEIEAHPRRLDKTNANKLLKDSALVVDLFDNGDSRRLVQEWCRGSKLAKPLIHAGLFESYGEVAWDLLYDVPKDPPEGDPCDHPLSRNLISLTVAVLAEEVLDWALSARPRLGCWTITLKDLQIRKMT